MNKIFSHFLVMFVVVCPELVVVYHEELKRRTESMRKEGKEGRKGQREKEQKQTRDTCGERRSGFRLKPHKKNNFAVGEEIKEGLGEAACKKIFG